MKILLLLLFDVIVVGYSENTQCTKEKLLSMVICREGQSTPSKSFIQDPWKKEWESIGYGQLSKTGIKQMYQLGEWLHQHYLEHIPAIYAKNSIFVRAIDNDVAITSAYALLAGLYPMNDNKTYDLINQQLIPVHTEKIDSHPKLTEYKPYLDLEAAYVSKVPETTEIDRLEKQLNVKLTGVTLVDIFETISAARALDLEKKPLWSDDNLMAALEKQVLHQMKASTSTLGLARLKIGPIFHETTDYMNRFIANTPEREDKPKFKAVIFAVGLDTMVNIMNGLKTAGIMKFPEHHPRGGSAILVELREDCSGEKFINIFFKNATDELVPIKVEDCGVNCNYHIFVDQLKPLIFDYEKSMEENEEKATLDQRSFYGFISPFGL